MKTVINNIQFECTKGNIVEQNDIEAIVNAANAWLKPGGGVAGAIHKAAGPGLAEECKSLSPIITGEAVLTKGYNLPNRFVIHCLGPVYGEDKPEEKYLSLCYKNALSVADKFQIKSIAFPSISTGIFGYPLLEASKIAVNTVLDESQFLKNVKLIRFVLFSEEDYNVYKTKLKELSDK